MSNTEKIREQMLLIGSYLKDALIVELVLQGHRATGELLDSIEHRIVSGHDFVLLHGQFALHGRFVDSGRKAGVKRVPIDALVAWIKQKGFETDAKKIRGMAFAIQKTIFEKGISQPASWAGDTTAHWMTKTLAAATPQIDRDIEAAVDQQMELVIENMIDEATQLSRQYGVAA